jgi:hypothetical protein
MVECKCKSRTLHQIAIILLLVCARSKFQLTTELICHFLSLRRLWKLRPRFHNHKLRRTERLRRSRKLMTLVGGIETHSNSTMDFGHAQHAFFIILLSAIYIISFCITTRTPSTNHGPYTVALFFSCTNGLFARNVYIM